MEVRSTVDAALLPPAEDPTADTEDPRPSAGSHYWASLLLLVALTVGDGVLVVLLFDIWGERFSLFINQGTALVCIAPWLPTQP